MIVETAIFLGASSALALARKARRRAKTKAAIQRIERVELDRFVHYDRTMDALYNQVENNIRTIAEQTRRAR